MDSLLETGLPGTPDFDTYAIVADLTAARCDGVLVELDWSDGRRSRFHALWLRDNCAGPESLNDVTREQTTSPLQLSADVRAEAVWVDAAGALNLRWAGEDFVSRFHPGWLRHHDFANQDNEDPGAPPLHLWDAEEMPEPATFDGGDILNDDTVLEAWLSAFARYGIARLTGVAAEDGMITRVGERLGTLRVSNFGILFDVKSKIDADSNAFTALELEPHTDLGTREYLPGLQFLHCLRNTAGGGRAVMVDGYRVAEAIRAERPDVFRALCEIHWTWTNRHADSDYRWRAPILSLHPDGGYREIRATYFPARSVAAARWPAGGSLRIDAGAVYLPARPALPHGLSLRAGRSGRVRQPPHPARPRGLRPGPRRALAAGLLSGA